MSAKVIDMATARARLRPGWRTASTADDFLADIRALKEQYGFADRRATDEAWKQGERNMRALEFELFGRTITPDPDAVG